MASDDRVASLSPVSPMYTQSLGAAESAGATVHGPVDADSQSTFRAPSTRHAPRSAPVVSNANSAGSLPEPLMVKYTAGCERHRVGDEFSTSSERAWSGIRSGLTGTTPIVSVPTYNASPSPIAPRTSPHAASATQSAMVTHAPAAAG